MILQKLASAIRRQDWFQIVIEVLIVIVGIFIGLQVDDWNNEREERVSEQVYLDRLHSDIYTAMSFSEMNLTEVFLAQDLYDFDLALNDIRSVIDGTEPMNILSDPHCHAIMGSHVYNDQNIDIPALRELSSSGQLDLIESTDIKRAISNLSFAQESSRTFSIGVSGTALLIARKYPELIELNPNLDPTIMNSYSHTCHFERMLENLAFRNDIIDNASRMRGFVATLKKKEEMLENLHVTLDRKLGIAHTEDGS
ncbi:MAG: hypothetical protein HOH19_13675 [Kordiimonadaceae bacterium]|jgi:hypothetical protein|nr:hypothetical protein [Kordiimonadaceae bacterium]MBT6033621.1 hypothetical protein [Kordiimonadaceae bacterium]